MEFVFTHKHFVVIFSEHLSWSSYINSNTANAQKKLGFIKIKTWIYTFPKITVTILYFIYKASFRIYVWWMERVYYYWFWQIKKKLQLIAARIVTGLPIFASRESLYFETGWETHCDKMKISRLKTMFKINQIILPSYIMDIFPKKRNTVHVSNYTT